MILFKLSSQLQQGCESEFIVSQLSFHLGQKKKKNQKSKKTNKKKPDLTVNRKSNAFKISKFICANIQ